MSHLSSLKMHIGRWSLHQIDVFSGSSTNQIQFLIYGQWCCTVDLSDYRLMFKLSGLASNLAIKLQKNIEHIK